MVIIRRCAICGKQINGKGPKKYCLACSKIAYKMQQSQWRDKHKTTSGTEIMKCERCGKEIKRKNTKQRYCIKCGNIVNREGTRDRARDRARAKKELLLSKTHTE